MTKPTRCLPIGIPPLIFLDMEYNSRHATCCWGEPAHAQAGNEQVSPITLTHLRSPTSSRLACHDRTPPAVAATGESGRWPGPLLTVLDACECHSRTEGNIERIHRFNTPHPHIEGRRCVSKPVSSQPGESRRQDPPRRNPRAVARGGGQRLAVSGSGGPPGNASRSCAASKSRSGPAAMIREGVTSGCVV